MLPQSVGASVRGGWGKGGGGRVFANHRCVQVLQGGEPGNNFLGHEIWFYEGEILLASRTVVLIYNKCENFRRILRGKERDFCIWKVTFRRPLTLVWNHTASVLEFLSHPNYLLIMIYIVFPPDGCRNASTVCGGKCSWGVGKRGRGEGFCKPSLCAGAAGRRARQQFPWKLPKFFSSALKN